MGYTVEVKDVRICIHHNGKLVGAWAMGSGPHLAIHDPEGDRTLADICRSYGFTEHPRPSGTGARWWRLPESGLPAFRKALQEITREELRFGA